MLISHMFAHMNTSRLSRPILSVPQRWIVSGSSARFYSPSTRIKYGNRSTSSSHCVYNNFPVAASTSVPQQQGFASNQKRPLWQNTGHLKGFTRRDDDDRDDHYHPLFGFSNAPLHMSTKDISTHRSVRQKSHLLLGQSVAPMSISAVEGDRGSASSDAALSWNTVFRAMLGNSLICVLKFTAWVHTGSGAMFAEAVHTLVDCGNQALLLKGLQHAAAKPDSRHQYGYGKAAYFWALVSALGMFWTGAGLSLFQGAYHLQHPPEVFEGHSVMLAVLGISFAVDGYVLVKTLNEIKAIKSDDVSMFRYMLDIRDPFLLAVVLEDAAACTGVLFAMAGIGLTYVTGDVFWDSIASIGIGTLLGMVALRLARVNQQFLMGRAVDNEIIEDIRNMIAERSTIDAVYGVKSQWISPNHFAFKAAVDFSGAELAKNLHSHYAPLFQTTDDPQEIRDYLNWYAEDVTTLVELEVQAIEDLIQSKYPAARYVELEPDSGNSKLGGLDSVVGSMEEAGAINIVTRGYTGQQAHERQVEAGDIMKTASETTFPVKH